MRLLRRWFPRFARHVAESLVASLLTRCKECVPITLSVLSIGSSHDGVAHCLVSLASHDGVAHCFASLALQPPCARGVVGPFASLVTRRRCSLLRFSCVATTCTCGAVGPFVSLVTRRHRSLLCISCVANGVCLWRRRSFRFARHMTASFIGSLLLRHMAASLIASLLSHCERRAPVASSAPSLRSSLDGVAHRFACLASHAGVAHCFASLASQDAVGPSASLVTRRRRSLPRFSCVANDVCLWHRRFLCFARQTTASLITSLL